MEHKYFICPWCVGENKYICEIHGVGITAFYPKQHIVEKTVDKKMFTVNNLYESFKYYETDKCFYNEKHPNNYVPVYEKIFKKFEDKNVVNILEIGVGRGSSLKAYSSLFKQCNIVGIDINEECKNICKNYDNINIIIGDIIDPKIKEIIPFKNFDIIIDDGSHLPDDIIKTFNNLFEYISPSGVYIIEDLTCCRNSQYPISHLGFRTLNITMDEYLEQNTEEKLLEFLNSLKQINNISSINNEVDGIVVITKTT